MDSTLLIDVLNGFDQGVREIRKHKDRAISVITWIEVMAGVRPEEEERTQDFLRNFQIVPLSADIASEAAQIRKSSRLKLPDAVILATAYIEKRVLLTRNTRDFSEGRFVRIPYKL